MKSVELVKEYKVGIGVGLAVAVVGLAVWYLIRNKK